jgi:hypothetical protein
MIQFFKTLQVCGHGVTSTYLPSKPKKGNGFQAMGWGQYSRFNIQTLKPEVMFFTSRPNKGFSTIIVRCIPKWNANMAI